MGLQIQRRAHIIWEDSSPRTVFIVKKSSSLATSQKLSEIGDWCVASCPAASVQGRREAAPGFAPDADRALITPVALLGMSSSMSATRASLPTVLLHQSHSFHAGGRVRRSFLYYLCTLC